MVTRTLVRPEEPSLAGAPRPDTPRAAELTAMFGRFIESTQKLEQAYHSLRDRAARIDQELAGANEQLRAKVAELNQLNDYLNRILESMQSGVVAVDRQGVVTRVNRAAEEMLHVPSRLAVGARYGDIVREADGSASLVVDTMRGRRPCGLLRREILLPGGGRRSIESSLTLIRDGGTVLGCLDIFRDLTEIEALEAKLRNADRLATLGQMAACVAHEVRNPLNAIEGFASLLARDFAEDDLHGRYARNFPAAVKSLERTVSGLLIFARPRQLSLESVCLREMVDDLVEITRQDLAQRRAEDVRIEVEYGHEPNLIGADGDQLRRAILNLMRNACEAMPRGGRLGVRTRIGPPRPGQAGNHVEIQVSDTGEGIPPEVGAKLFQPFVSSKAGGVGLGLAIVQKVAELHRGEVLWNSTPGEGTTFTLRIPLRQPTGDTASAQKTPNR